MTIHISALNGCDELKIDLTRSLARVLIQFLNRFDGGAVARDGERSSFIIHRQDGSFAWKFIKNKTRRRRFL